MDRELFEERYAGCAPWDIAGPQPAIVGIAESGRIRGRVLDVGCGTGENALYLAQRGHAVLGLDFVPAAIDRARAKAGERQSTAEFQVADALELSKLGQRFDTIIDCGLFHTFSDEERPVFVRGLHEALVPGGRLFILCFSDAEPGDEGPRRVSQSEIHAAFADG